MRNILLSCWMLIFLVIVSWADAITFQATVSSTKVSLDEVMQLTLTFSGVNQNLDAVSLPVIDGFTAKYLGPSTSVSIINGNYHSERSFIYNLFPNKVGHFQIPPISATYEGQTYTTKPINVEVVQSSVQSQSVSNVDQGKVSENLNDKVILMATVDRNEVYLNERIPVTIKLFVNDVPMRDIQFPQFDKTGFIVDDFEKPVQSAQVVNGVKYDTVEFKTSIYPNRLGDMTFGPARIQGNVLYKNAQSNSFNQDNFFGSEIFNNFFNSYAVRPVTVMSQPVELHVAALPKQGRPAEFSGAIGQSFDFQATISPLQVKVGDPLTLKMTLTGNGNFKNLKMPEFKAAGFKSYELQIKDVEQGKQAEQVIIPIAAGIKEVPAVRFSYFDTSVQEYKTVIQGPFPIEVVAASPEEEFKAVGFTDVNGSTGSFNFFAKAGNFLKSLIGSFWFWFSVIFVGLAGASWFMWRRFQHKLQTDAAFARRLIAIKEAKKDLLQAEEYVGEGKVKEFYGILSKTLHHYLANKWHLPPESLTEEEILSHLKNERLEESRLAQLKTLLDQADLVCFAGVSRTPAQMHADLAVAQELINYLEKLLK